MHCQVSYPTSTSKLSSIRVKSAQTGQTASPPPTYFDQSEWKERFMSSVCKFPSSSYSLCKPGGLSFLCVSIRLLSHPVPSRHLAAVVVLLNLMTSHCQVLRPCCAGMLMKSSVNHTGFYSSELSGLAHYQCCPTHCVRKSTSWGRLIKSYIDLYKLWVRESYQDLAVL